MVFLVRAIWWDLFDTDNFVKLGNTIDHWQWKIEEHLGYIGDRLYLFGLVKWVEIQKPNIILRPSKILSRVILSD